MKVSPASGVCLEWVCPDGVLGRAYSMLSSWFHEGGYHYRRERELLRNYPKLPVPLVHLQESDLKYELETRISDCGVRESMHRMCRSISSEETSKTQTQEPMETTPSKYNSIELILAREAGLGMKSKDPFGVIPDLLKCVRQMDFFSTKMYFMSI